MRFIHPSELIRREFPARVHNDRLDGCVVVWHEEKTIRRKRQRAVVFTHDRYPNEELYVVEKYCKVTLEGTEQEFFDNDTNVEANGGANRDGDVQQRAENIELPAAFFGHFQTDHPDVVDAIQGGNIGIDDDNLPVPENIPNADAAVPNDECVYEEEWGHDGICARKKSDAWDRQPKFKNYPSHLSLSKLQLFEILFPTK